MAQTEITNQFYTIQSMTTLAGATGATFVIANGIQQAFNYNPKWLALVIAMIISILGIAFNKGSGSDYVVGVVNGFLIYCTATGTTQITGRAINAPDPATATARGTHAPEQGQKLRRKFFSPWF